MVRKLARLIALGLSMVAGLGWAHAQNGDAKTIIQAAVKAELAADDNDHTRWRYRDLRKEANNTVFVVVETDHGSVKRLVGRGGRALDGAEAQAEDARVQSFVHDREKIAKQKKDAAQDDKNARELLTMLPNAFKWTLESEDAEKWTLHFEPTSDFSPPDMQSRVLGAMAGKLVVDKKQHRIMTMSGKLLEDVTIGWGLLGRLHEGGTFRVERREVAPGLWQITETHVHIEGKALFFKNIGQQQDEVQSEFTQVPAGTTLEQAVVMSKPGNVATNGTASASVK